MNSGLLSVYSPVFAAMFNNDMMEKKLEEIELKAISSTTSEHFGDFLDLISPMRILPNRLFFFKTINHQIFRINFASYYNFRKSLWCFLHRAFAFSNDEG